MSSSGSRMQDPEAKRAMLSRLARVEGQVRGIQRMIEGDEDCEAIAQQLSASRKALDRAFYEMVACMIKHGTPRQAGARSAAAGQVAELLARYA